ncbi:MAG: class I SAM-dependent methyltransferase [Actinobacteria bacterium]|nr:class I SAM-dependent methyltransferase [Actinomycetota bacterium]
MEWDERVYGERIAEIYDDLYDEAFDKASAVAFLEDRSRGSERRGAGNALELAIGTGRIALPLAQRGVQVQGIDISDAMVAKLQAKAGGSDIPVTIGNFADVAVAGRFDLIYVVFNTIFALTTQDDQLKLFRNVADHLEDEGLFVVEAFVPDMDRFDRHQNAEVNIVGVDHVQLSFSRHDPVTQTITSQQVLLSEGEMKMVPVHLRYIWPSEMDLMARLGGMELRERYSSWNADHFTSNSKSHISVYGKA